MKKIIIVFLIFLLCGCNSYKENINTIIEHNNNLLISINYPTFNIKKLDKKIEEDVLHIYNSFKDKYFNSSNTYELNIDYDYNISNNLISVILYVSDYNNTYNTSHYYKIDTSSLITEEEKQQENIYIDYQKNIVDYNKPVIALTFDDGPSKYTKEIVDILNKYEVKATFFVLGNKVSIYKDTLKYAVESGNEIGNHSYNHKWLIKLSEEEIKSQIDKTQEIIKTEIGITPTIIRPTYGSINNTLKNNTTLDIITWDIDSLDWKIKNSKKIANKVIKSAKDSGIILMHDTYKWTMKSLDIIIPELINQGYQFVTISELNEIKLLRNINEE